MTALIFMTSTRAVNSIKSILIHIRKFDIVFRGLKILPGSINLRFCVFNCFGAPNCYRIKGLTFGDINFKRKYLEYSLDQVVSELVCFYRYYIASVNSKTYRTGWKSMVLANIGPNLNQVDIQNPATWKI